jgi:Protein of unknown function (DUF3224)
MNFHAAGTFDVKLTPQPLEDERPVPARMKIDKVYHGGLDAASKGEMLSAMGAVAGSAGYVAIEKVIGKLRGRAGTFVLQHSGRMTRGEPYLSITVVPDSGTEELAGLTGAMKIQIAEGKHSYEFDYTLES